MNKKTRDPLTRILKIGSSLMSISAGLLAVLLILYSGYVLYDSLAIEVNAFSSNSDLLKYKPSVMAEAPEGTSLADINPDYRGWITVSNNPIDYPIVQGEDDLYYASRDANKEVSLTGAIYLAAQNNPVFSDNYNLLYGHHMDSGAMFGSLDKFREEEYFKAHKKARVIAKDGTVYDVTFFAVASTDAYEKQIYTVGNRSAAVKSFLTGSRADDVGVGTKVLIYEKDIANKADKILALSTCASADTNGRLVLFGSMAEKEATKPADEETEKPTDEETDTPTAAQTATPTATPAATPTSSRSSGSGSNTPTPTPTDPAEPTETPEPDTVKLTVIYLDEDGNRVFPDEVFIHAVGDSYYVVSPQLPGYEMSYEILQGTITEDMSVIVRYSPKVYQLTVKYVFVDGREASPAYTTEIRAGESYTLRSPKLTGYRTKRLMITGVNPGRDEIFTVIYVSEDVEEYTNIDDYETPLNPGYIDLQIGVCIE